MYVSVNMEIYWHRYSKAMKIWFPVKLTARGWRRGGRGGRLDNVIIAYIVTILFNLSLVDINHSLTCTTLNQDRLRFGWADGGVLGGGDGQDPEVFGLCKWWRDGNGLTRLNGQCRPPAPYFASWPPDAPHWVLRLKVKLTPWCLSTPTLDSL